MQPFSVSNTLKTMATLRKLGRQYDIMLFIVIFFTVFSLTPLLVLEGVMVSFGLVMGGLAALVLAAVVIRWPLTGLYVVAGCALLVEENSLPVPTSILTDNLYIFSWPPSLEGLFERPIGFLFIIIFFAFLCQRLSKPKGAVSGGALLLPFLFYLLCVVGGVVYGLTTGGDLKITVVEVRPFWYLFVSYLLAYNLIAHKNHIVSFFWLVIVSAGVKGLQGVYIYLVVLHGNLNGYDSIMSHEESFFFAALFLLLTLFCLHSRYRPQFYATLLVLPCVLVAFVANQRRADYIALLIGIVVVWILTVLTKPQARKPLVVGMLVCAITLTGYIVSFAHSPDWFAQPAHAIVSTFSPDSTDMRNTDSNLYRLIENTDLKYTIARYPFGFGFGKPFFQSIPLVNIYPQILQNDPYYNYIPHNNIYWIWMRLGLIGYFAFWYLFGMFIIRGCLIVRTLRDSYLQVIAIYTIAVTFMEVVVAFADYQLFFYRNVIYLGLLVGVLMKLPTFDDKRGIA